MPNPQDASRPVPTSYDRAETVEELAKRLISKYHPHLANCKIAYLYKNKDMKSKGRVKIATAEKCSPKLKALTEYDFLIVVSFPAYNSLSDKQKRAIIDHELEHCWCEEDDTGELTYSIIPHDVEEFGSIIQRHGLYYTDLEKMGRIVKSVEEEDASPEVEVRPPRHDKNGDIVDLGAKRLKKLKKMKKKHREEEDLIP